MTHHRLEETFRQLRAQTAGLRFGAPVRHVYNPLDYAWETHLQYLHLSGGTPKRVVLVGMNPGPWGMTQTGVPFGEIAAVQDWLGISGIVKRPADEHPKRPILGFECPRSEVSGRRLWGWARDMYGTPESFFRVFFVANYCPLQFLGSSGRNLTPDRLAATERATLFKACDKALRRTVELLRPQYVVGVGAFAEARARAALGEVGPRIGRILHPSPASPAANRGWADTATRQLADLGVALP
jgi:single-strand selective monofunctional uracil DNA glycosylase